MDEKPIKAVRVFGPVGEYGEEEVHECGLRGVTRIEAYTETGEYCTIPYIRVWAGDEKKADFCKHAVVGVYYDLALPASGPEGDGT